ncbi:hypothetical protein HCU01_00110 [Halomonas cupida]|uniref:Uncharacterized protein n=1 Tax=Halomonas cupida TaxID=44933 RepID=A0A1M7BC76_9GAMM|nr:hypothetical protein [Halomonas cupida]GEN22062.1 hypothetical protein HCU01_00110 [Halomonas cupida]SHL52582.1 hypothetical protein SAMN05660971_00838 [Halomonas cupida]
MAMMLLKAGYRIKDAFVIASEGSNGADVESIVAHLREEVDAIVISCSTLKSTFHDGLDKNFRPASAGVP